MDFSGMNHLEKIIFNPRLNRNFRYPILQVATILSKPISFPPDSQDNESDPHLFEGPDVEGKLALDLRA
ncbi:hypothetical protein B6K69_13195 [Fuscovulum blasticum]|nr:hypothetical protein B6K69_13195 [Fuscovulum blasticum]